MVSKGCTPEVISYTTLINGYCKSQRMDKAMDLFQEMCQRELIPDVVTYNTLVLSFLNVRKIQDASSRLDDMIDCDQFLNCVTQSIFIYYLCKNDDWLEL